MNTISDMTEYEHFYIDLHNNLGIAPIVEKTNATSKIIINNTYLSSFLT